MSKLSLIAIDGPSGVGKSTTAKRVAQQLGWGYLDTGAMYRATALALQRAGVVLEDRPRLERVLAGLKIQQRGIREYLDGEDVTEAIRTPEITRMVTPVSADARVREVLVDQQRRIGGAGGWVVDGRDIGTVVFPEACCKIFLTASVDARAGRLSGGGSASELWSRIVASVLDIPLERTESQEGSAFGAALLAGVRSGVFADVADAVTRCVRVRDRVEPDPDWAQAYAGGYERYRMLYPALRELRQREESGR